MPCPRDLQYTLEIYCISTRILFTASCNTQNQMIKVYHEMYSVVYCICIISGKLHKAEEKMLKVTQLINSIST